MTDDRLDQGENRPDEAAEQESEEDVEGHVWLRSGSQGIAPAPDDEEDVEGHALYRSPASRGE